MKGFFNWFNNRTKLKRWMFLILLGVVAICFAISTIINSTILRPSDIIKIVVSFVIGFTAIVVGFIFMQRRVLEILIEANNTRTEKGQKANINIKSLIFNKTMYDEGPKVVVIGGGSGLNTVIRGLKKYTNNITAIVNISDYGLETTQSRKELGILPYEEIKDSIVALSDQEELMEKLFNWNFKNKKIKGLNFGDIYLAAMNEIFKSTSEGIRKSTEILNITGQVIPSTLEDITICAELENGTIVENKEKIPEIVYKKLTKIKRIHVAPSNCKPAPGVVEAIENADAIIIGPGSLYTNVLPNLIIKNIAKAIRETKAIKIYITNLMTEPGQTDNYSISDHLEAIFDHGGKDMIDYCLADTGEIVPEFIRKYNQGGQDVVLPDIDKATKRGIKVVQKNLSRIDGEFIRHDPDTIASSIMELICNDLKFRDKESTPQYMLASSILEEELEKERKKAAKMRKDKKQIEQSKRKAIRGKSKFNTKYRERIESIQTTTERKYENQKLYKEMEKMDK